ncbi:MAG: (2Fe-2S)-binding protein [Cytophagaceae bacterium]|nr:(2Fe-2S)-binding protein [Cytophagaceae bacterium]
MGIVTVILAIPFITAMLEPFLRQKKPVWRRVAEANDFKIGETKKVTFKNSTLYKWSSDISKTAAYVRRDNDNEFIAFSVNCSHLGCPVRWEDKPQLFCCPCHGGAFYRDGSRAAGPPNRGLYKYPIRIKNGSVELETQAIPITNITV